MREVWQEILSEFSKKELIAASLSIFCLILTGILLYVYATT